MQVNIYGGSCSGANKQKIMRSFYNGVLSVGQDKATFIEKRKVSDCDIAVMLGFYPPKPSPRKSRIQKKGL